VHTYANRFSNFSDPAGLLNQLATFLQDASPGVRNIAKTSFFTLNSVLSPHALDEHLTAHLSEA
jgi:hypothetical protein